MYEAFCTVALLVPSTLGKLGPEVRTKLQSPRMFCHVVGDGSQVLLIRCLRNDDWRSDETSRLKRYRPHLPHQTPINLIMGKQVVASSSHNRCSPSHHLHMARQGLAPRKDHSSRTCLISCASSRWNISPVMEGMFSMLPMVDAVDLITFPHFPNRMGRVLS